jgi:hypothetical protein
VKGDTEDTNSRGIKEGVYVTVYGCFEVNECENAGRCLEPDVFDRNFEECLVKLVG